MFHDSDDMPVLYALAGVAHLLGWGIVARRHLCELEFSIGKICRGKKFYLHDYSLLNVVIET